MGRFAALKEDCQSHFAEAWVETAAAAAAAAAVAVVVVARVCPAAEHQTFAALGCCQNAACQDVADTLVFVGVCIEKHHLKAVVVQQLCHLQKHQMLAQPVFVASES